MSNKIYDPKRDIINTLSYKKIFNQPLTKYQLLYFGHCYFMNLSEINESLTELIHRNKIKFKNNKYFLNNTKFKDTEDFYNISKTFIDEVTELNFIFERIPFIQMVAVTGSLASFHFNKDLDDIDLFIICKRNRLWITRFLLVTVFKILNIYVNNKNPDFKICPNLYISETNMIWPDSKRNIYVANEIAMMHPIYQKNDTYFKFLYLNNWVLEYLPNLVINEVSIDNFSYELKLLDVFESFFMYIQKSFMKVRSGAEILNKNFIHFLKIDHSVRILDSFERIRS